MTSILVVEDEPVIREVLAEALAAPAREIHFACSCAQARDELGRAGGYEVVIVDKNLPDGSGVGLLREAKAADPLTEVLLITAFPSMDTAIEALALGAFDYLLKPFDDLAQVEVKVRNAEGKSVLRRERARLQEELRQNEERYRAVFNGSPDGMLVVDQRESVVREANLAAARLYGRSPAELVGMPVSALTADSDYEDDRGPVDSGQPRLRRDLGRDGKTIDVEVESTSFEIGGQLMSLEVIRDVTDRLRQEAEQRELQEELRHAQKMQSLGQLAGGIAHDFNNLITVLVNFGEFLVEAVGAIPGDEQRQEAMSDLEQVRLASSHAASITRQLLAFSRREIIRPEVISVNDTMTRLQTILRASLGPEIILTTRLSNDLWNVKIDRSQLERVVINLALNARDAMCNRGTLTLETRNISIDTQSGPLRRFVEMTISDTGTGVDESLIPSIFEPFFSTKGGKGTGLGLASVKSIVEGAGGTVSVASKVGAGTAFAIRLPATDDANAPSFVPSSNQRPSDRRQQTILVVDDDDGVRRAVLRVLRRAGYEMLEARSGEEALELYDSVPERVSILLTDVVLGGISGERLARELRARRHDLPVVFMTGYATKEGLLQVGGFVDSPLLPKPFRDERLLSVLDAFCRRQG